MTDPLEILYQIFYADQYDEYNEASVEYESEQAMFIDVYKSMNISVLSHGNPMKHILNNLYLNDDIQIVKRMLSTQDTIETGYHFGWDYDIEQAFFDFESEDAADEDNNDLEIYQDEYGREGINYYHIHTSNYLHVFSKQVPFGDYLIYNYSEKRK